MSADNCIWIVERGQHWEVRYGFMSDGGYGRLISRHDTLDDAYRAAHELEEEILVLEYGIRVVSQ